MKTNQSSKLFRVTGIVTIVVSVALLCVLLSQIFQGSLSELRAAAVTYYSEDAAAVAQVQGVNMLQELSLLAGFGLLLAAGVLAAKYAEHVKKVRMGILLAAGGIVCLIASLVYYNTAYITLYNTYDIYPLSGTPTLVPLLIAPAAYIITGLLSQKAAQRAE